VSRPLFSSKAANTLRGSMGLGARRWFSTSMETVCAADSNAAAVAFAVPVRLQHRS
jgi:hypothetical protein